MRLITVHQFHVSNGGADAMPVGGNTVYYTNAVKVEYAVNFALIYKAAVSAGAPDLKIELEQSWRPPTTEYSSDGDYVEGADVNDVESSLTATTRKHKAVSPNTTKWLRLKISGAAGNHASATLEAMLSMSEQL